MSATAARPQQLATIDPDAPEIERMARDAIASSAYYGAANVVMQLAKLPVGRGVAESTVDSGRVDLHPLKRQRTTAQYLIVAMLGTEAERRYMRREVNKQHRQVRRSAEESDVPYNAFHSDLQLWVAACIYVGFSVWLELSRGPLTEAQRDAFYLRCARLGTTLQVPDDEWPADRQAFQEYWWSAMDELKMDDVSRTYLQDLVNVRLHRHRSESTSDHSPSWQARLSRPMRRWNRFVTLGFLAPQFRAELHEDWTRDDQRRFERFLRVALWLDTHVPAFLRHALLNVYEVDVKRRIRNGRAIV